MRIRNEIGQWHQDVLLHEQLSASQLEKLARLGFDASLRLEVWTEFVEPPEPEVISTIVATETEATRRGQMAEPDIWDDSISFGVMALAPGRSFAPDVPWSGARVAKRWLKGEGKVRVLVESAAYAELLPALEALPESTVTVMRHETSSSRLQLAATGNRLAKKTGLVLAATSARAGTARRSVVIDYTTVNTTLTNFICRSDDTIYVAGTARIAGLLTIEGGTVVKFTNSPSATIIASNVLCKTGPYRPATFTSKDDNSIGEILPGSTGNPTGHYGAIGLDVSLASNALISGVRFCYLSNALAGTVVTLEHAQIVACKYGFARAAGGAQRALRNALVYRTGILAPGAAGDPGDWITAENVTAHFVTNMVEDPTSTVSYKNCLFVCATNWSPYSTTTNACVILNSDAGVFQTNGAAAHYLAEFSPYRGAGVTNITESLLQSLRGKTTEPPLVYSNRFMSGVMILSPRVRRAAEKPDIGYMYDPLDYAFGSCWWTNGNITVTPGTAIGVFSLSPPYGFSLWHGMTFACQGSPNDPVRIVRYNTVQEPATTNWTGTRGASIHTSFQNIEPSPNIRFRFTQFIGPAQDAYHLCADIATPNPLPINFRDCEFHSGRLTSYYPTLNFTNCLLARVNASIALCDSNVPAFRNNTVFGGVFDYIPATSHSALIKDNLFDGAVGLPDLTGWGYDGAYNVYVTNASDATYRILPAATGDYVAPSSPSYQSGPLGGYYHPANSTLMNRDTATAAGGVGLYHYTIFTNFVGTYQLRETNSWLDTGYHYVALATNGLPFDTDGGGAPDWLEDYNGDGSTAGDTNSWTSASDDYNHLLVPQYLRCEYRENPLGVDAPDPWTGAAKVQRPRLYWTVTSPKRAQQQVAYQINVATNEYNLTNGIADMWDSGKVWADDTIHVEYNGKTLQSGQRVYWRVRSWDRYGGLSKWSTNAFFQMGLLNANDWSARWLMMATTPGTDVSPMYRTTFQQPTNTLRRAIAVASAKGVYELWINGERAGRGILAPEWTDYDKRIQYQTIDVTEELLAPNRTDGTNHVVGAIVAEGWFSGSISLGYTGRPKQFLLQLILERTDGTIATVVTDSSWKCNADGPVRKASIEDGETYDATKEASVHNWALASYSGESLYFTSPVTSEAIAATKMCPQPCESIEIIGVRSPVDMWTNRNGGELQNQFVRIFDMGQNLEGWCSLELTNTTLPSGSQITLRHAELLQLDAQNRQLRGAGIDVSSLSTLGDLASQKDTFIILNSPNRQLYSPRFTYHGFRYVEVAMPEVVPLNTNSIQVCVIHSAVKPTGAFTSSHSDINQVVTNTLWSLMANLYGIETGCSQRSERYGWLGDSDVLSQSACFLMDMSAFYTKIIRDIRDEQNLPGTFAEFPQDSGIYFPCFGQYMPNNPWAGKAIGDIGWSSGGVIKPWQLYQNYGDVRMLREHYESASNWVHFLKANWPNNRFSGGGNPWTGYGDWVDGDTFSTIPQGWATGLASPNKDVHGNCHFAYSADILANMSHVLQQEAASRGYFAESLSHSNSYAYYSSIATSVRSNFQRSASGPAPTGWVWYDSNGNLTKVGNGSQGDHAYALYFNMIPDSQRSNCMFHLLSYPLKGIRDYNKSFADGRNTNHLSTGIMCTSRAMLELVRNGQSDLAYDIMTDYRFPSWLYLVTNGGSIYTGPAGRYGATTLFERWNSWVSGSGGGYAGNGLGNSFNHLWQGTAVEWCFRYIGGLSPDNDTTAFRKFIVDPLLTRRISHSTVSMHSIVGSITNSWQWSISSGKTNYTIALSVPANGEGTLFLPSATIEAVSEGGIWLTNVCGLIARPELVGGKIRLVLGSGDYRFDVPEIVVP